ncbi:MAG: membrane protein insertase YidC [Zoogloeaceae bacterium]|jgi:YidC/Oxa1 family membrane protein insertase|nr:membrane protein insertase YidC [Zoogloeaceae bacterium]
MDTRRLMLLAVFLFSLFMLWDSWQRTQHPPVNTQKVAAQETTDKHGAVSADIPKADGNLRAVGGSGADAADISEAGEPQTQAESVFVETDLVRAEISARGGDIVWLGLKRYRAGGDANQDSATNAGENAAEKHEELFALFSDTHSYSAQSGLIGAQTGAELPNHKTMLTPLPGKRALSDGEDTLEVRLAAPERGGIRATKVYTFHRGSYLVDVAWEIENESGAPLEADAYFQLQRDGKAPEGDSVMLSTFTGAAVYTDAEKYQKNTFDDIAKGKAKFMKNAADGWLAVVQHYFVAAWAPESGVKREFFMRRLSEARDRNGIFSAGVILPVERIESGKTGGIRAPLFAGPQEQAALKAVAPGLDLVVDYGWLHIIAAPIFWLLGFFNRLLGNWGWSIVALTVLIKLCFYPLSAASYRSMARMRLLTPKLTQIKERCADDRMKMNQEMMRLYQTEKINPLGGCLPILVQIPVFIALYWVLLSAVEMRGAPWAFWIHDLSASDPYYVLPTVMMISMFAQTRLNPTPTDPIQAKMMLIMPLVFGVLFFFFPAGLVLYWVVNNLLSIAQQWQINRLLEAGGGGKPSGK